MNNPGRSYSVAAVFRRPGEPLQLCEFALPVLQSGEVLVKITCCTICGSDLHTIQGDRPVAGPIVLGHEMIGTIADLPTSGPVMRDVTGTTLAIGDRVTWSVAASCGVCFYCKKSLPQKCEHLFKYGHETTQRSALSGGLAEYCHLERGTAIVKVPDELPDHAACPANCATATVAAAVRTAGGCAGKAVVIHGAGMLGLTTAAMASIQGATSVIVTDLSNERLDRAKSFGATHAINVAADTLSLTDVIHAETGNRGVDVVFEMSGAPSAIENSIEQLRIGGQLVLVGSVFPTRAALIAPEQVVRKLLRVDGVHNYQPSDLQTGIDFLTQAIETYSFEALVSAEFRLANSNDAIRAASAEAVVRVAIRPNTRPV